MSIVKIFVIAVIKDFEGVFLVFESKEIEISILERYSSKNSERL
ncbi:MAG: hypothetical protein PF439_12795 [Helicobacteraceae bacterium]|nr:hypothetical protein [Helicobacteraceae bacterium]